MKVLALALLLTGCTTVEAWVHGPQPWDGKLYIGDAKTGTIYRKQDGFGVSCQDPKFDTYVCLTQDDFTDLAEKFKALRSDCREPDYD